MILKFSITVFILLEVQTIFSKYFVFIVYHITNVKIEELSEK